MSIVLSFCTSGITDPQHGGKRPGAGRPKAQDVKVSQKVTVLSSTMKILDTIAFAKNLSVGEVIDEKFNSAGLLQS